MLSKTRGTTAKPRNIRLVPKWNKQTYTFYVTNNINGGSESTASKARKINTKPCSTRIM